MKQLAFRIISSTSLKNVAQISSHSFWTNELIFIVFRISILCGSYMVTLLKLTPTFDGKTCS